MKIHPGPIILFAFVTVFQSGFGATGPVVSGPPSVAPSGTTRLGLSSGTTGTWTIDWGDGTPSVPISFQQSGADHVYSQQGIYEVTATFRNAGNETVDVQRDYAALVTKSAPLLYCHFNDGLASQGIGATLSPIGGVTFNVPAPGGGTGGPTGAVKLNGNGYLQLNGLKIKDGNLFGVEFWLRPSNLIAKQVIFSGVGMNQGNVRVFLENKKLNFELVGSGIKSMDLGSDVEAGRWYHFAVSYERSPNFFFRNTVRFYLDGFLRKEEVFTAEESQAVNLEGGTIGASDSGNGLSGYLQSASIDEIVLHRLGVFPGGFLERDRAVTDNFCRFKIVVGADGSESFAVDSPNIIGELPVALDPDPSGKLANRIALQDAINRAVPGTRLKILNKNTAEEGGTYYIAVPETHAAGYIFQIKSKTDLEINGGGALLLFSTPGKKYFEFSACTRVALRNIKVDVDQTSQRPSVYAVIQQVDQANQRLVIRYVKGKNLDDDMIPAAVKHWRWRRVDRDTRVQVDGFVLPNSTGLTKDEASSSGAVATFIVTGRTQDEWNKLNAVKNDNAVLQINNANFSGAAVNLWSSQHMTFENIDIYGVMGMAFLSDTFDYLKVSNVRVCLPPGLSALDRPFAACADGFHFHAAKGGHVLFENNEVCMTDDDPVSIKGPTKRNVTQTGARTATFSGGDVRVGSILEFRTTNLVDLNFKATVTAISGTTMTLDKNLPGTAGSKYHAIIKDRQTEQWVLRNNRIYDLSGRMMIYTHDGTVQNNRIERMYSHIGMSAADFEAAGNPYDLLYLDNYFVDGWSDISVWGASPTVPIVKDVNFIGNSFHSNYFVGNYADRFVALGNYHERVVNKDDPARGAIYMAYYSRDIRGVDGTVYDPMSGSESAVTGSTSVSFAENEGHIVRHHMGGSGIQVIVDNTEATFTGSWTSSAYWTGYFFGADYRFASTSLPTRYVTYTPNLPESGKYQVYAMWNGESDRGETVRYVVTHAGGTTPVVRSQRSCPGLWVNLGTFEFAAGTSGSVRVETDGSNGIVIADAIRFNK